jgi:hypothetical protein
MRHKSISTGAPKTPPKMRPALILGSRPKLVHHRKPKILLAPVGSQINSRRSRVGPCAIGPYRERRHHATCWKNGPGSA